MPSLNFAYRPYPAVASFLPSAEVSFLGKEELEKGNKCAARTLAVVTPLPFGEAHGMLVGFLQLT